MTIMTTLDGFKATSTRTDDNPTWGGPHRAYQVRLTNPRGKRYTVDFHMGIGLDGDPQAVDVLRCLVMDADSVQDAADFEDWAADMGADPEDWDEVRRLRKSYKACQRTAQRLADFLTDDEREEIRHSDD